jgi:general secretion pathway protein K
MPRQRPPPEPPRRSGGFALLIVLWTLVLIAFIVAHITASGRTEVRIAGNLIANSVAQAAADGAIYAAIFNLANPQADQRWPLDGSTRQLAIGDSRVTLLLEDEASRINPNTASPELLEALLRNIGSGPEKAKSLAGAIAEWVGSAQDVRPPAAILADYQAAGLDYQPPGAALDTLDELGRVLGMTPILLAKMRPHLTLFGPAEPNPAGTDPVVRAALALVGQASGAAAPAEPTPPELVTARITALAVGPGNARVARVAVVRIGAALQSGYAVLAWANRSD